MMKYSAIILLGGSSRRFNGDINKVYLLVNDKPIFKYSVDVFLSDKDCEEIIIVYNKNDEKIISNFDFDKKVKLVTGGVERYESVLKGLEQVTLPYVLVHDGARPLINLDLVNRVKEGLEHARSVSLGVPVSDTIKMVDEKNVKTIDRDNLYYMQTPQGSYKDDLIRVLKMIKKEDKITDDLMAFEKYSDILPIIVLGDKNNIKITTNDDYDYVKYLMEKRNV